VLFFALKTAMLPCSVNSLGAHIQAGVATIGPNKAKIFPNGFVEVDQVVPPLGSEITIEFPQQFTCPPVVVANTLQDPDFPNARDVFAVSIRNITTQFFTINVRRVDTNDSSVAPRPPVYTWDQNLQLSWIAIGSPAVVATTPTKATGPTITTLPKSTTPVEPAAVKDHHSSSSSKRRHHHEREHDRNRKERTASTKGDVEPHVAPRVD
jgi:hypothetical protein